MSADLTMRSTATSSVSASDQATISMTPEQQGVFFEFFKARPLPDWLSQASTNLRAALHARIVASQVTRVAASKALSALKSPQQFCTPLLSEALAKKLGESLDIRGVVFQHIRSTSSLFGLRKKLVLPIDRDLLIAACDNFEASETLPGNYHEQSIIYQPERMNGKANKILAIQPHEFAHLCRTLDLGKHYQTHLNSVFEPNVPTGQLLLKTTAHTRSCLDVDRHLALMKNDINADVFRMLGELVGNGSSIKLDNKPIACKQIDVFGHSLHGALLIVAVSNDEFTDNPCVLYLPGAPEQPLKAYPNLTALQFDLYTRLDDKTFEIFLLRFVLLSNRAGFHSALATRGVRPPTGWLLPSQATLLPVTARAVAGDPFVELYRQRVAQVMADARLLVVPTDDEDEKSRLARMETYKTMGLDLVLFGVSFIPVVGEVLMAVAAGELLLGVYHGLESWSAGEQEQATDYFFDTVENLITMAALSAGVSAARAAFKTVRTSTFVESLRQVQWSSDTQRLWKPDLAPYRQSVTLPTWLKADEKGLHWFEDQAYLALDKDLYAVRPVADTGVWEIEGSKLTDSYSPRLETNNLGAWRHDSELPGEWTRLQLFRRLGYAERDIPDARAMQILSVTGINEDLMRRVLIDRTAPPALLLDTVRRFDTDQSVTDFIAQLQAPSSAATADADLQLRLLTSLTAWPPQTAIQVTDPVGGQINRYLAEDADPGSAKTLKLTQDRLLSGQWYADALSGLDDRERERLLDSTSKVASEQASALVAKLAEQADRQRGKLFQWIYQRNTPLDEARATPLRDRFAQLPISVIDELIHYADGSELAELDAGNVPLRLAEEARRFEQVVRVSRAYEGLYLDAVGGIDTDRLVFSALKHLPGWKGDLYVQMLEFAFYSDELASIGLESYSQHLRVSAHPDRYEARDAESNLLSYLPGRTRAHYFQALWEGLSVARREALEVAVEDQGAALREKITALALARRPHAEQILGMHSVHPGYVSPMRLADVLLGTASGNMPSQPSTPVVRPAALVRRAQELFPTHSLQQIDLFLASLDPVDVLALRKLEAMRLEFLTIRQVLQNWINRDTWTQTEDGPRLKVSVLAKTRAAQEIIRCWRRETASTLTLDGRLYELALPPLQLGDLPMITGDFSHVGTLVMDRVGASAGLNTFLHNFKFLRRLSLVGNRLTRLQHAIGAMSRLEVLDLSENQIQLSAAAVVELAGLTRLKQINLSANPSLGRTPDVAQMQLLERLELRGTAISEWPKGASGLPRLRVLDLRDNRITDIPEDVFSAALLLNKGTDLFGNPLSANAQRRVADYQQLSDISLGLSVLGRIDVVQDVLMDTAMSSTWLTGASDIDMMVKRTLWNALYAYPGSRPFFLLLARLRYTADFRLVYRSLSRRVWDVIEAAAENSALRATLFRMANIGQVSADGSSLLFSDLHVRVLCYRAMTVARAATVSQEGELTQLLRGLFRLQEVERLALANVITRARTGPVTLEQAMEISLAYRVGLAERLNLPAQPRDVNFQSGVEVLPQTLDWVYAEVVKLEHTQALAHWITQQQSWTEYLEGLHRAAFDDIVLRATASFGQLDGRQHFTREQFNRQMDAIVSNFANERVALFRRLTAEALERNPGLPLPVTNEEPPRTSSRFSTRLASGDITS